MGMLIKAIANNCPNIKVLYTYLIPNDFIHIKSLLINCKALERIQFSILDFFANENENIGIVNIQMVLLSNFLKVVGHELNFIFGYIIMITLQNVAE